MTTQDFITTRTGYGMGVCYGQRPGYAFSPLDHPVQDEMVVLADRGFHAREGDPPNLTICRRGEWNVRMAIETILPMLSPLCHFEKVAHRAWEYFQARRE